MKCSPSARGPAPPAKGRALGEQRKGSSHPFPFTFDAKVARRRSVPVRRRTGGYFRKLT